MDTSLLVLLFALAAFAVVFRLWLARQDGRMRILAPLGLLSIAMYVFAFGLTSACHGAVDFVHAPTKCTHPSGGAFNPNAWRVPPR